MELIKEGISVLPQFTVKINLLAGTDWKSFVEFMLILHSRMYIPDMSFCQNDLDIFFSFLCKNI